MRKVNVSLYFVVVQYTIVQQVMLSKVLYITLFETEISFAK